MTTANDIDSIDVTALCRAYSREGWGPGPSWGEVYEMGRGAGWIAGRRSAACRGLGLMDRRHFRSLRAAKKYADDMTD